MKFFYYLMVLIPLNLLAMEKAPEISMQEAGQELTKKRPAQEELEEQEGKFAKIEPTQEEQSAFDNLPNELKKLIVSFLISGKGSTQTERLYNAASNIRNLMLVNKTWKEFIEDFNIHKYIIIELANRYTGGQFIDAAIALATKVAGDILNTAYNRLPNSRLQFDERQQFQIIISQKLVEAAQKNEFSIINFLTSTIRNIPPNILDKVLVVLCSNNRVNLSYLEKMIQKGANINGVDENEITPLHMATLKNNLQLVTWLLNKGANVNSTD